MKKILLFTVSILVSHLIFSQSIIAGSLSHGLLSPLDFDRDKPEVNVISLKTGVQLEYVEQGSKLGIPVIFLHGLSDSWHSFEKVLPHIPASIRAFAISQRGHGNSAKPLQDYQLKNFSDDVAAFIEQQKLGAVVIVGHSMGGVVVQQFALDYPQLVKAVVIISSDHALKLNPGMPEFLQQVMQMDDVVDKDFMVEFQKGTLNHSIDSTYFNLLVDEGLKCPMYVFKSALKSITHVDFTTRLKEIKKPCLIVWGDKDNIFARKGQDILFTNIRGAKRIIYKDTGHAFHWEQPERFANDLKKFISQL